MENVKDKCGIVIVGFGGMGGDHYRRIKRNKILNVIGIYDIDGAAQEKGKKRGLKVYPSYDAVLADGAVDAVLIATPNDVHYDYVLRAAAAKKHILCEKPVTLDSELLSGMIAAAEKNGVVFMVNQNRRQDGDYVTVKEIIESGILGRVYKIESNVLGSHGIPGGWRKQKEKGGGMIYDWGVHLIDQALMLIPSEVTSVYCRNSYVLGHGVDDGCDIRLTFENGLDYKIYIDTNAFVTLPRWMIYGENGTAVIYGWSVRGKIVAVKMRFDAKNKGIRAGNGFTKTMAERSAGSVRKTRLPRVKSDRDFIYKGLQASIFEKAEPVIKTGELSRVMRVMEAAFLSDEKNQVVTTVI